MPVQAQRTGQPQRPVGVPAGSLEPAQRRPQVRVLPIQSLKPPRLRRAAQAGLGILAHAEEMCGVGVGQRVVLACLAELACGVLAQGLQHPVPGVARGLVGRHEGLAHEPFQQVEYRAFGQVRTGDDVLGGGEGPAAAEHGQPSEQHPLRPREQLVAPVHCVAQCLLAGVRGPAAGREHREPVNDAVGELTRREARQARRGQLQSKRDSVEPAADHADSRQLVVVEDEIGRRLVRPVQEQSRRGEARHPGGRGARVRDRERPDRQLDLSGHGQRLPAGGHDPQVRAVAQHGFDEGGDRLDEVLAVVQHDEDVAGPEVADEQVGGPPGRGAAFHAQVQRVGDRVDQYLGLGHRGEADQPGAVAEPGRGGAGRLDAQCGLACTAGPDQRDQPGVAQQIERPGQLSRATDERRGPRRQVACRLIPPGGRLRRRDRRVLAQDLLHHGPQLARRVDPELVGQ